MRINAFLLTLVLYCTRPVNTACRVQEILLFGAGKLAEFVKRQLAGSFIELFPFDELYIRRFVWKFECAKLDGAACVFAEFSVVRWSAILHRSGIGGSPVGRHVLLDSTSDDRDVRIGGVMFKGVVGLCAVMPGQVGRRRGLGKRQSVARRVMQVYRGGRHAQAVEIGVTRFFDTCESAHAGFRHFALGVSLYVSLELSCINFLTVSSENMPRRVLVADDSEMIRTLLRSQIEEFSGIEVCAAVANGIEAVEAAITLHPDLIILDVVISELNIKRERAKSQHCWTCNHCHSFMLFLRFESTSPAGLSIRDVPMLLGAVE